MAQRAKKSVFDSGQKKETFLFSTVSRLALGPTQSLIQWVLGAMYLRTKKPGREADNLLPFN
jgi:hypothetical protein